MSIRLICPPAQAAAALAGLADAFTMISVRGPRPCRGDDPRVRYYLEVQP